MKELTKRTYGKSFAVTKNAFKRDGYTFVGWNTAADGTGILVKDKEKVSNLTAENPATYTIEDAVEFKAPTLDGYEFKGWYSDILGLKKVTEIEAGKMGNVTLYARWKKIK